MKKMTNDEGRMTKEERAPSNRQFYFGIRALSFILFRVIDKIARG
jgi:hypothetical protein